MIYIVIILSVPDEASSLISDYEDSSSNDDGETETELEFKGI